MGVADTHIDDSPLVTSAHDGPDGTKTLRDMELDFRTCGVMADLAVENETDSSSGVVVSLSEHEVVCTLSGGTNNTWTKGDTYAIYKTDTQDSVISTIFTDKSRGLKVTNPDKLNDDGWFPEDADLDRDDKEVFGPGQPERRHDGR